MKNTFFLVMAIITLGFVSLQAQPKINYKQLPKGVTKSEADRLVKSYAAQRKKTDSKHKAETEVLAKKVEATTATARRKLDAILKKDKSGNYNRYKKEVSAIAKNKKLSDKQRATRLKSVNKKYYNFFKKKYAEAKIDEKTIKKNLKKFLPKNCSVGEFLCVTCIESQPVPPPVTGECLTPPFAVEDIKELKSGVSAMGTRTTTDLETGEMSGFAQIVYGGGYVNARSGVGDFINVPDGVRRINVTVDFDIYYNASAMAIVGVGYASGSSFISINSPNGETIERETIVRAIAPLIYFAGERRQSNNYRMTTRVNVPNRRGGEYLIMGHTEVDAWCGVFGIGLSSSSNTVKQICVDYER